MELQSSLSISCSLSLILIGLILHIDQNKEEKTPVHKFSAPIVDLTTKTEDCRHITVNQKVFAPQITEFFIDSNKAYLSPALQSAFASDSSCLSSDSTLIIKPENKVSLAKDVVRQTFEETFQRVDKILAANHSREKGPVALEFKISVAEKQL